MRLTLKRKCYNKITLETEDLSFKFSDSSKEILHGLTLKIEQGGKNCNGANGSGKQPHSYFIWIVASHLWVFVHQ
jgi:ABC-type transport system involved in cytochrome bd biosynthesis fused ATPase/permease subunit